MVIPGESAELPNDSTLQTLVIKCCRGRDRGVLSHDTAQSVISALPTCSMNFVWHGLAASSLHILAVYDVGVDIGSIQHAIENAEWPTSSLAVTGVLGTHLVECIDTCLSATVKLNNLQLSTDADAGLKVLR